MSNKITVLEYDSPVDEKRESCQKSVKIFLGFNKIGEIGKLIKQICWPCIKSITLSQVKNI
jgi:hypothetical protein